MAEPIPMAVTAQDNDEDSACSTARDDSVPRLPESEASPVARATTNNTPTEVEILDPAADGAVDAVTSIAAPIPTFPGTQQFNIEATENEPAVVASLEVLTSEDASMADEPVLGASVDDVRVDSKGGGGTPVDGTPDLVLDENSAQVTSVGADDGLTKVVDESLVGESLALGVAPVVVEPTMATMMEVSFPSISAI